MAGSWLDGTIPVIELEQRYFDFFLCAPGYSILSDQVVTHRGPHI